MYVYTYTSPQTAHGDKKSDEKDAEERAEAEADDHLAEMLAAVQTAGVPLHKHKIRAN